MVEGSTKKLSTETEAKKKKTKTNRKWRARAVLKQIIGDEHVKKNRGDATAKLQTHTSRRT